MYQEELFPLVTLDRILLFMQLYFGVIEKSTEHTGSDIVHLAMRTLFDVALLEDIFKLKRKIVLNITSNTSLLTKW